MTDLYVAAALSAAAMAVLAALVVLQSARR